MKQRVLRHREVDKRKENRSKSAEKRKASKLRAQRKFAHGVAGPVIVPSTSREEPAPKEIVAPIIHLRSSVRALLDEVAFRKIHVHKPKKVAKVMKRPKKRAKKILIKKAKNGEDVPADRKPKPVVLLHRLPPVITSNKSSNEPSADDDEPLSQLKDRLTQNDHGGDSDLDSDSIVLHYEDDVPEEDPEGNASLKTVASEAPAPPGASSSEKMLRRGRPRRRDSVKPGPCTARDRSHLKGTERRLLEVADELSDDHSDRPLRRRCKSILRPRSKSTSKAVSWAVASSSDLSAKLSGGEAPPQKRNRRKSIAVAPMSSDEPKPVGILHRRSSQLGDESSTSTEPQEKVFEPKSSLSVASDADAESDTEMRATVATQGKLNGASAERPKRCRRKSIAEPRNEMAPVKTVGIQRRRPTYVAQMQQDVPTSAELQETDFDPKSSLSVPSNAHAESGPEMRASVETQGKQNGASAERPKRCRRKSIVEPQKEISPVKTVGILRRRLSSVAQMQLDEPSSTQLKERDAEMMMSPVNVVTQAEVHNEQSQRPKRTRKSRAELHSEATASTSTSAPRVGKRSPSKRKKRVSYTESPPSNASDPEYRVEESRGFTNSQGKSQQNKRPRSRRLSVMLERKEAEPTKGAEPTPVKAPPRRRASVVLQQLPLEELGTKAPSPNASDEDSELELLSPVKPTSQESGGVQPSASTSVSEPPPCTSSVIRTMRDLSGASASVADGLCKACDRCRVIAKAQQLHDLLKPPCNDDVYDFDAHSDDSVQLTPFAAHRQSRKSAPDAAAVKKAYLDILCDSDHVVEVSLSDDDMLLKTRFVQRKDAHESDSLLYTHEPLFDQLIKIVTDSSVLQIPARHEKSPMAKFPRKANMVEAPTFHLTEAEFNDPIEFYNRVGPAAQKFGICKVVAPASFKPTCKLDANMEFTAINQYVARLYSRWGSASRMMAAMKSYLLTQQLSFARYPTLDSVEVDLPKLYQVVQSLGGLSKVMEKQLWGRVTEQLRIAEKNKTKLENVYVKYILPYDTASLYERQQIMSKVERRWNTKYKRLHEWSQNPLHAKKKLLGESESSDDDDDENDEIDAILKEVEECVVRGRRINNTVFKKVATNTMEAHFPNGTPSLEEIEKEYWRIVLLGTEHVYVNAASIETGAEGYGFSGNKHPWNLKMLSSNSENVLRSLGNVLGVTVPTLHFGMVFTTSCWHRDPHGLPWIEYMHEGPAKIWYGIPDEQSDNFRKAVEVLCPTSCQNKSIWLPSDISMIPPNLLQEKNVALSRLVQNPGEFVIVFPKSYSSSFCTGFTVSESVYFATSSWLQTVNQVFQELRDSSEPSMFSLEHLLIALAQDKTARLSQLQLVHSSLSTLVREEIDYRRKLASMDIKTVLLADKRPNMLRKNTAQSWNVRDYDDCQICRCTLYLSKVTGLPDRKSTLCLHHAQCLLERPKYGKSDLSNVRLEAYYSEKQLDDVMGIFNKRLFP